MAFQDVNARNFVNLKNTLAVGESYTGYAVKYSSSKVKDKVIPNLVMQNAESGEIETIGGQGNIRYMLEEQKLVIGQLTRITRIADRKVGGLMSSQFRVEQDPDDTIDTSNDAAFESIPNALSEPVAATRTNTPVTKAMANEKVKRQAEALAAQATKSK